MSRIETTFCLLAYPYNHIWDYKFNKCPIILAIAISFNNKLKNTEKTYQRREIINWVGERFYMYMEANTEKNLGIKLGINPWMMSQDFTIVK